MERNWYLVCTAQNKENKVAALLNKKGIESFCPNALTKRKVTSNKMVSEMMPIFRSFVFAFIPESEIVKVKETDYVSNLAYWKSKPAVISQAEIDAVKTISDNYSIVSVAKTAISTNAEVSFKVLNNTTINSNMVSIKHNGITVTLPSLGIILEAERVNNLEVFKKQPVKTSFANKIASSLFFFGI